MRKKKKGTSLTSKKNSALLIYKKLIYGMDIVPNELLYQIIEHIRENSINEIQAVHLYRDMLQTESFYKAVKASIINPSLDIRSIPLGYNSSSTIDDNLSWIFATLTCFSQELSFFIHIKIDIENAILKGNFEEAHHLLDNLKVNCGESLWGVSTRLSCYFFEDRDSEILKFRSDLPDDINTTSSTSILFEVAKSRTSTTYQYYLSSLSRQREDLRAEGLSAYEDLIKFRYNFEPSENYNDYRVFIGGYANSRLCDLYSFFLRTLRYCYINQINLDKTLKEIRRSDSKFNDYELTLALGKFDQLNNTNEKLNSITIDNTVSEIFDAYIAENFDEVIRLANIALTERPSLSIIYEIVAKSINYTSEKLEVTGPLSDIIECISNLYNKYGIHYNVKKLSKIFLNLKQCDWAYHLKAQVYKYEISDRKGISKQYNFADMVQVNLNPFDLDNITKLLNTPELKKELFEYYGEYSFINESLKVNADNLAISKNIPIWRFLKLKADYAFHNCQYEESTELYNKLLAIDCPHFCSHEVQSRLIESYFLNSEYDLVINKLSEVLLAGFEPSLFPLKEVSKYIIFNIKYNTDIKLLEACAVILHYYNTEFSEDDISQEISNISENLIRVLGFDSLDSLEKLTINDWPVQPLILTHVLTIDVLDGFIRLFDDDIDVYIARIKICSNLLRDLDSEEQSTLYRYILNEYNSAFNRMVLYVCSSDEIEGRIQVDKESLKVLLLDELDSDYSLLKDMDILEEDFKRIALADHKNVVTISGSKFHLKLTDMIAKIFKEYTVNKLFGLDNSLNVGFRHGEIVNHFWAPLKSNKIAGRKLEDGTFNVEAIFEDYKLYDHEVLNNIKNSYSSFLKDIDQTLIGFRNLCHVDSGEDVTNVERLFGYPIKTKLLDFVVELYKEGASLQQIIEEVFDMLDDKTDLILSKIKNKNLPEFRNILLEKFANFIDNMEFVPRNFEKKINLAKAQCEDRFDKLDNWFAWSGDPKSPFVLGAANHKAKELVSSLYPTIKIDYEIIDTATFIISSPYFTSFATLFSLIQENSVKHCGYDEHLSITESFLGNGDKFYIKYSNDVHPSKVCALKAKIEEINENLAGNIIDKAAKDTGSGIYKIKSILDNRIKLRNQMHVLLENNRFNIVIEIFDIEKIKYEDLNS
ncbi:hypothetical protein CXF85_05735 [Colwellia sp. 75C3]|uniref:hypothetical protein n=1 Tax=Colwellia sp. 75C3 TaxID=888425 RepID=UPI000C34B479|nr:hypothetical protein [Colwellia sp. 75C3]PKG85106.1 hypothetical protein CXF85_05735 [Colwellia sp. 75C3]